MKKKNKEQLVKKAIIKMKKIICDGGYSEKIIIDNETLYANLFIVKYQDGLFVISFERSAYPHYVANVMKKLAEFDLEVGELFYVNDDGEIFLGEKECQEQYLLDIKEEMDKVKLNKELPFPTVNWDKEFIN